MEIKKAVIPAAGWGTRFLPITKSIPKEMLPILDKPIIQYVVEEAVNSGISDIIIVTGTKKKAIEDYFDRSLELEGFLKENKKEEELEEIKRIANLANFIYLRQKTEKYGNAIPVLMAQPVIGKEWFAVLWGDEFILSKPPRLKQMFDVFEKYKGVIISAVRIKKKRLLSRYGIAEIRRMEKNVYRIKKIIEKPSPEKAPSNLATHGAYILPPEIFEIISHLKPTRQNEFWLTDAINILLKEDFPVYACEIENGRYYDTGNKLEYLKTVIEFALSSKEFKKELKEYLRRLI